MEHNLMVHFGDVLTKRLSEVEPEMRGILADLMTVGGNPEPMDEADLTANRCATELMMLMQHRNSRLVREIHSALHRLTHGEFGICTECGDPIGIERLKVQPMTPVCLDCKRTWEAANKKRSA